MLGLESLADDKCGGLRKDRYISYMVEVGMAPDDCIHSAFCNINAVRCQNLFQRLASSNAPPVLVDSLYFLWREIIPIVA